MENVVFNSKRWRSINDLEDEKWAVIKEYPNYAVSNYGRVKRLEHYTDKYVDGVFFSTMHYKERIVKLSPDKRGYLGYRPFGEDKKLGQIRVHQEVARYFVPNPLNLPVINHKNEQVDDNRYTNLEFCTYKYNSNYGTCQQRRSVSVKEMRRNRAISIEQYTLDGDFVRHYSKKGEIDDAGFNLKTVLRVCKRTQETAGGYVWRFTGDSFTKPVFEDCKGGTIRKKVMQLSLDGKIIRIHKTLLDAALWLGDKRKRNGICQCCYRKKRQSYGFIWKYV